MGLSEETHDSARRELLTKAAFVIPALTTLSLADISVAASGTQEPEPEPAEEPEPDYDPNDEPEPEPVED